MYGKNWSYNNFCYSQELGWSLATSGGRNVAIDRSSQLAVVKLSDSLPNLVAVSEASSGRKVSSNDDSNPDNLAEQTSESSFISVFGHGHDSVVPQDHQADWGLATSHYPWPPISRLADFFGFSPGNVAIDRRRPLVVKLSDSLPNHVADCESLSGRRACRNDDTTLVFLAEHTNESSGVVGRGQDDSQVHQAGWQLATSHHRWPFAISRDSTHPVNHVAAAESSFGRRACENDDATLMNLKEQTSESSVIAAVVGAGQDGLIPQFQQAGCLLATSHHRWPFAISRDSTHPVNHVAAAESSFGRRACENDDTTLMNLEEGTSESSVIPAFVGAGQDGLIPRVHQADWRLATSHDPWPPVSRLVDFFGFPPGYVAIDRRRPLVVKLPDSLPNHVADCESASGRRASTCSNDDATHISLAEICPEQSIVRMRFNVGGPLITGKGSHVADDEKKKNFVFLKGN